MHRGPFQPGINIVIITFSFNDFIIIRKLRGLITEDACSLDLLHGALAEVEDHDNQC